MAANPVSRPFQPQIRHIAFTAQIPHLEELKQNDTSFNRTGVIWDTIVEVPDEVGLTDSQKAEIDRRLDAYHRSPEEGSPWDMVRERILSRQ
jgi:putative addiction module component (TIGR02574 family)